MGMHIMNDLSFHNYAAFLLCYCVYLILYNYVYIIIALARIFQLFPFTPEEERGRYMQYKSMMGTDKGKQLIYLT